MLSVSQAFAASLAMAAVILFCRSLPFLFFSGKKTPRFLSFVEKYMPALAMTVLAFSPYASLDWGKAPRGLPELLAGLMVVALHLWKRNPLLSILGGTGIYMILGRLSGA